MSNPGESYTDANTDPADRPQPQRVPAGLWPDRIRWLLDELARETDAARDENRDLHAEIADLRDRLAKSAGAASDAEKDMLDAIRRAHHRVTGGTIDDDYERGRAHALDDVARILGHRLAAAPEADRG